MSNTVCATWLISLVVHKLLNFVNLHNDITYMQWTPCLYIPLKDQFYITYCCRFIELGMRIEYGVAKNIIIPYKTNKYKCR